MVQVRASLKAFPCCSRLAPYCPCPMWLNQLCDAILFLSLSLCLQSHEGLNNEFLFISSFRCLHSNADSWILLLRLLFFCSWNSAPFLFLVASFFILCWLKGFQSHKGYEFLPSRFSIHNTIMCPQNTSFRELLLSAL